VKIPELIQRLRSLRDLFEGKGGMREEARVCLLAAETLQSLEANAAPRQTRAATDEVAMRDALRELWKRQDPDDWDAEFAAEVSRLVR